MNAGAAQKYGRWIGVLYAVTLVAGGWGEVHVWDHCSRKKPKLPFIRMGDGALLFRASAIEAFIDERERLSGMQLGGRRRA